MTRDAIVTAYWNWRPGILYLERLSVCCTSIENGIHSVVIIFCTWEFCLRWWGHLAGTCECGNEPSGSIKCGLPEDPLAF